MDILFSEEEVQHRIAEIGAEISCFYKDKPLTLITLMTGGLHFAADLSRKIDTECWIDSIGVASYENCHSSGKIQFRSEPKLPVAGRHILLLDEVLDSGITLKAVAAIFNAQGAASVKSAVLVEKDIPRPEECAHADWCCFHAPNRYLIGCGMDANEKFRNLPFIAALD